MLRSPTSADADDLATEVTLMETRLASGYRGRPEDQGGRLALRETLDEAHVLGDIDNAGRTARQDPRAGGFNGRRGEGPSRRTSRRLIASHESAGRRGRRPAANSTPSGRSRATVCG